MPLLSLALLQAGSRREAALHLLPSPLACKKEHPRFMAFPLKGSTGCSQDNLIHFCPGIFPQPVSSLARLPGMLLPSPARPVFKKKKKYYKIQEKHDTNNVLSDSKTHTKDTWIQLWKKDNPISVQMHAESKKLLYR